MLALGASAPAQPAPVLADPTTGALFRPSAATFISGNSLLTTTAAAAAYQPLDADLTSWAAVTRASGFDTFAATPSSANLATLVTGETGSGALVFGTSPTFTTPTLGAATATSITGATDLTLAGGSTGASLVLGATTNGVATLKSLGTGRTVISSALGATTPTAAVFNDTLNTRTTFGIIGNGGSSQTVLQFGYGLVTAPTNTGSIFVSASDFILSTAGSLSFGLAGGAEWARFATTTGNLLIGTTTDITGTGGLHVAGTGTASTTTSGALRVGSNVGLSGNAGGPSYFGGSLNVTGGGATLNLGTETTTGARIVQFGSTFNSGSLAFQNGATVLVSLAATGLTSNVGFRGQVGSGPTAVDYGWSGASGFYSPTANNIAVANNNARVANFSTTALTLDGGLTVAGTVIHTLSATPASASAAGTVGTMSWDANYIYICTATNTWKRVAIATW